MSIRKLAQHLNISIGTVSRALNDRAEVSAATRRRVLEAAAALSYSPNRTGRNLRSGSTHAVAFMLQLHPGESQFGEPFFMSVLSGLQTALSARGLDLILLMAKPGDDHVALLRRLVEARWTDAVVLAWTHRRDARIEYLVEAGFPFATLGRSLSGGQGYPALDMDFAAAGATVADRLLGLGHRRIGLIGPSEDLNYGLLFREGYRRALVRHGLAVEPDLIAGGGLDERSGHAVTTALMRRPEPPTALVYNNHSMALGGYRALSDLGLRPGHDVAIMGAVDSPIYSYLSPAITCFQPALQPLGERLGELLLDSMPAYCAATPRIQREVLPMNLVIRESDRAPPLRQVGGVKRR